MPNTPSAQGSGHFGEIRSQGDNFQGDLILGETPHLECVTPLDTPVGLEQGLLWLVLCPVGYKSAGGLPISSKSWKHSCSFHPSLHPTCYTEGITRQVVGSNKEQ